MKYDKYTDVMESTGDKRLVNGTYTDGLMTTDFEITERWYQDMNHTTGMWIPECIEIFTHVTFDRRNIPIFDETLSEDRMEAFLLFLIDKGLYTESDAECIEDTRQSDYYDSIRNGCIF